ncbi:serine hydrolase domain-containing protein [Desertibaculum subflavum]|uniref:serine hydrolase domain-containing protein n=1 Tax=Desertibaculum subflavum TaxID=2268458 RepID=UPI000E662173
MWRRAFAALAVGAIFACRAASVAAGSPVFDPGGPEAERLGLSASGFPVANQQTFWQIPFLVDSHSRLDEIFPARRVARSDAPRAIARAVEPPPLTYRVGNEARTIDGYLARNPITGLIIAKDDTILVERYQYGRLDTHRLTSWSMAKTVVSMLIGIAREEGAIRSLDDKAQDYVQALAGTEYGRTPLRRLLTMSSGVKFREDYDGSDDVSKLSRATLSPTGIGGLAVLGQFNERIAEPGQRHYYASSETEVLGLVLAAAVGRPLSDYLSERIWQPIGAESDASWQIDPTGQELGYCCLNAVLRDWARLALLLANGGRVGERQLVPSAWLREATMVHSPHLAPGTASRFFGYGYQTWIFPENDGSFALLGVRGQMIFVDPATKLVMVNTAVRFNARDPGTAETVALWRGLRTHFRN